MNFNGFHRYLRCPRLNLGSNTACQRHERRFQVDILLTEKCEFESAFNQLATWSNLPQRLLAIPQDGHHLD